MDTGTEAAKTGMDAVIAAMDTVTQLMGRLWELRTSTPLLRLLVAAGLSSVGVGAFVAIRNAARG